MSKASGLGDNYYVGGYNLSGDMNSLTRIGGGNKPLDVTGIDKSAFERIGGVRDGAMDFIAYMNPTANQAHSILKTLPRTDTLMTYFRGTAIGNPSACLLAKQVNYDPNRAADGGLTNKVNGTGNAFGVEWGLQLTAGPRTDVAATNGTSIDTTASVSFGAQAYLQVFAVTATDVTVRVQDSADNISFADVAGLIFQEVIAAGGAHTFQRLQTARNATIRRYLRAITTTSAGFTTITFAVTVIKNDVSVVF